MSDKNETSSARSAVILAAVLVLLAAFAVEYGLQTLVWISARHWASANPMLRVAPEPLAIASPAAAPEPALSTTPAKNTLLKAYEYEFAAPWAGASKLVPGPAFAQFRFDSGQVIGFFDPESQLDTMHDIKTANSPEYRQLTDESAGPPIDSDYALYQAVYAASPAQTSPFMHSANAQRLDELLLLKLQLGQDAQGKLYSFDFGKNRGLQFGDPASGQPVALRVFDDSGKQFRLIFTVAAGSNAKIVQDDITTVARSLEPVPLLER